MKSNHSVEEYNKLVNKLMLTDEEAMAKSIGGNFETFGVLQKNLLFQLGMQPDDALLDLGCGSGRLANALKEIPGLRYTGIDVVQKLLDHAESICQRPDWKFIKGKGFSLPLEDNSVSIVTAFSLFTHLLHEESYCYLAEAIRVLKPNGIIVFSFLDFSVPEHWAVFVSNLCQIDNRVHLNQFMDTNLIHTWAKHLKVDVEAIYPGNDEYINASPDANDAHKNSTLGQSICVIRKPESLTKTVLAAVPGDFDPARYLMLNPDVKEAGRDPREHYLDCGQFEGRKWY